MTHQLKKARQVKDRVIGVYRADEVKVAKVWAGKRILKRRG